MKIRNGFVSNSSSSSFVIIGIQFSDNSELKNKLAEIVHGKPLTTEDDLYDILSNSDNYLSDDGRTIFGKVICDVRSEDGHIENSEIDINKAWEEAYELLKKVGIKKEEIKLICGTRSC